MPSPGGTPRAQTPTTSRRCPRLCAVSRIETRPRACQRDIVRRRKSSHFHGRNRLCVPIDSRLLPISHYEKQRRNKNRTASETPETISRKASKVSKHRRMPCGKFREQKLTGHLGAAISSDAPSKTQKQKLIRRGEGGSLRPSPS